MSHYTSTVPLCHFSPANSSSFTVQVSLPLRPSFQHVVTALSPIITSFQRIAFPFLRSIYSQQEPHNSVTRSIPLSLEASLQYHAFPFAHLSKAKSPWLLLIHFSPTTSWFGLAICIKISPFSSSLLKILGNLSSSVCYFQITRCYHLLFTLSIIFSLLLSFIINYNIPPLLPPSPSLLV